MPRFEMVKSVGPLSARSVATGAAMALTMVVAATKIEENETMMKLLAW